MTKVYHKSNKDDWETPPDFFAKLDAEFGFWLDVCATYENRKAARFIGPNTDSLKVSWLDWCGPGEAPICWMNPPYGARATGQWIAKAAKEAAAGCTVVALVPSRTDVRWWHEYVWDDKLNGPRPFVEVRFVRGRLKFVGADAGAPFPSCVIIFRPHAPTYLADGG